MPMFMNNTLVPCDDRSGNIHVSAACVLAQYSCYRMKYQTNERTNCHTRNLTQILIGQTNCINMTI